MRLTTPADWPSNRTRICFYDFTTSEVHEADIQLSRCDLISETANLVTGKYAFTLLGTK